MQISYLFRSHCPLMSARIVMFGVFPIAVILYPTFDPFC